MNPPDNNADSPLLDALLAGRPLRANASFADRTLARLRAAERDADEHLDTLLSARPVAASARFTEETLARLAATPADQRIDELAAAQPVAAAAAFTDKTLGRVRADSAPTHRQRWIASVAGLAAALVLTFATVVPRQEGPVAATRPALPSADSSFVPDAATDHALSLASGLSDAGMLLDDDSMELLAVLSSDHGI